MGIGALGKYIVHSICSSHFGISVLPLLRRNIDPVAYGYAQRSAIGSLYELSALYDFFGLLNSLQE